MGLATDKSYLEVGIPNVTIFGYLLVQSSIVGIYRVKLEESINPRAHIVQCAIVTPVEIT